MGFIMSLIEDDTMSALALLQTRHTPEASSFSYHTLSANSPHRDACERFIQRVFAQRYDAKVTCFAPEMVALEQKGVLCAAAGWRDAQEGALFLERYLDEPAETLISHLAGHNLSRDRIVEISNLAATLPGGGVRLLLNLAEQLDKRGYEWVIFTATQELIGLFTRLGWPPLVLASADPARLGEEAFEWGRYYDTRPVVVAGRLSQALAAAQGMAFNG